MTGVVLRENWLITDMVQDNIYRYDTGVVRGTVYKGVAG